MMVVVAVGIEKKKWHDEMSFTVSSFHALLLIFPFSLRSLHNGMKEARGERVAKIYDGN